jgi:ankyrin repeat protein
MSNVRAHSTIMEGADAYRLINACFASLDDAASLLSAEPALLGARTGLGETALHYLAVEDQLLSVKWLIEQGAEVNVVNNVGTTALSDAASLGYLEMVSFLLLHGARVNLAGESEPTLHSAVRGGSAAVVEALLAGGVDVNAMEQDGESALHVAAASEERTEVLRVLVARGAKVNARSEFLGTPLDEATANDCALNARILREHGALRSADLSSAP